MAEVESRDKNRRPFALPELFTGSLGGAHPELPWEPVNNSGLPIRKLQLGCSSLAPYSSQIGLRHCFTSLFMQALELKRTRKKAPLRGLRGLSFKGTDSAAPYPEVQTGGRQVRQIKCIGREIPGSLLLQRNPLRRIDQLRAL